MRNIVFVRPNNIGGRWMIVPPLGLGYLAAAVKQAGHAVTIHDSWLLNETPEQAANTIPTTDIVGIQVFYDTTDWVKEFIKYARLHGDAKIVVGGPQITVMGAAEIENLGADYGVSGEGEIEIVRLLDGKPGDILLKSSQYVDVNRIPIPDWESFHLPDYWPYMFSLTVPAMGKRPANIQRTRGCPFLCTFCAGHITHGRPVRFRSDASVIEEIKYLISRWNIDEVWFQDDNVIVNYERGMELFEKLAPFKLHIRFPNGIRLENVDERMCRAMKNAGVYLTGIGIESANARVLKKIKKSLSLEKANEAIGLLRKHGIITNGFFIFGLDSETREEMEDTIRFALKSPLHRAQFGTFIPYPGSEDCDSVPTIPREELIKIQRDATLRFYLRPRILWEMLLRFQWSQVKAFTLHPWVKAWTGRAK